MNSRLLALWHEEDGVLSFEWTIIAVVKDAREERAVQLWLDGAPTDAIAAALDAAHLPSLEQRRVAKQFKDRILKRLSRYLQGDIL